MRQIDPEQSVGVVYCDVTGLKGVNDTLGHKARDDLILRAGACLSKCLAITAYSVSGR
ncbi:MAG: diguanylate cyclase domain-containing protein [Roseburia sp.]